MFNFYLHAQCTSAHVIYISPYLLHKYYSFLFFSLWCCYNIVFASRSLKALSFTQSSYLFYIVCFLFLFLYRNIFFIAFRLHFSLCYLVLRHITLQRESIWLMNKETFDLTWIWFKFFIHIHLAANLQEGSSLLADLDERHDRNGNHGADSERPSEADRPARVRVGAVRHRSVTRYGDEQDELDTVTRRASR